MKSNKYLIALLLLSTVFSGCSAVADIFKAGAAFGIIAVIVVVAIIIWIISMLRRRS